jgi:hypothetical protein
VRRVGWPTPPGRKHRRGGATSSGRYRAATRAVAVSAVVSASLGVLAAADQHRSDTSPAGHLLASKSAASIADSGVRNAAQFTAFTPREAQMPQAVPEAVHLPGIGPVDPMPWLAARGIDVGHSPD